MSFYTHIAFSLLFIQLVRILLPYDVKIDVFFYILCVFSNLICFTPVILFKIRKSSTFTIFNKLTVNQQEIIDFTNSILCYLIFSLLINLAFFIFKLNTSYLLSLEIGYISHLILESFSVTGVRLLYPSFIRFSLITKKDAAFRGFMPGSKVEKILAGIFILLFVICLPTESYKKIIHSIIQNPVGALSDVKYEASEKETIVNLKGIHNVTHEKINKQFKACGWIGANSLIVEDTETGYLYSVGKGITDNIQPFSMEEKTGDNILISNKNISVYRTNIRKIISDIESSITDPDTRAFITGELYIDDEHYHIASYPTQYNPIKLNQKRIELQFARLEDLDRLKNTHITSGKLAIRYEKKVYKDVAHASELNYTSEKKNYTDKNIPENINKITVRFNALDISDIKVKVGQKVKKGDILVISSKEQDALKLENNKNYIDFSKLNNSIEKIQANYKEKLESKYKELELNKNLYREGLISEQAVKNIENDISNLKANEELEIASIQSEQAKLSVQIENNNRHIERLNIFSPIDGEVSNISVNFNDGVISGSLSVE
ncbi:Membrane-bound metal-dependent hydrolase YbcI, DUF457 family [Thermodesulfobium acidiphilum]|uniref:Membrane-bound metal-dependent hydrolase YbcI, DUF457 family n=1 Tax=Thermodesulfobium acidiphilum TaxID=1794699 RepID=A0A2R4VZ09_THEAF|nr:metal-dependent hydrolase [Thermodesulfobium acidiphilum]AWB09767.1 Membrane-bound metal-dependent hydrolase YbcI, DUF457 family [Thermodesulfobium acidiphilum]